MKMKNGLVMTAAFAALLLAGCSGFDLTPKWLTVGPDYEDMPPRRMESPAPAPDAGAPTTNVTETGEFRPAEGEEDRRIPLTAERLTCWWARFNDPILTNLVAAAVSNNLSYLMAVSRLEQARWRFAAAFGELLPQVSAVGAASTAQYGANTSSGWSSGKTVHRDVFRAGFDASWEIDVFGGTRRAVESARASMQAEYCSLEDAWISLTAEIGTAYVNLRNTQERLKVARANLKLQSETYDILKSRLDSGIGDELAVNQAKYNLEQTRAVIPGLLTTEENCMNQLAILSGAVPGALHDLLSECPDRDWLLEPERLDSIPMDAIRARPDVRAAERRLAAEVASVGVAKANFYPKFYLNGTLGLESLKVQKFLRRDSLYGSIGPSVSWPIFQGGSIYANVKEAEARMDSACLDYELVMQTAFGEVRDAYSAYTQEYHRYQSLQGAVKASRAAVDISNDLYKNGLKDFNNVLDAQRSLLTYEESLTLSRGRLTNNAIALYKALGGGLVK